MLNPRPEKEKLIKEEMRLGTFRNLGIIQCLLCVSLSTQNLQKLALTYCLLYIYICQKVCNIICTILTLTTADIPYISTHLELKSFMQECMMMVERQMRATLQMAFRGLTKECECHTVAIFCREKDQHFYFNTSLQKATYKNSLKQERTGEHKTKKSQCW